MRRTLCRSALTACIAVCAGAQAAFAALAFPSVPERTGGARFDIAPVRGDGSPAAWRIEVADVELFGVPGLRSSGARASAQVHSFVLNAAAVQVSSAAGAQARAIAEGGFVIRDAWQGVVRGGIERLSLDATAPVHARVTGLASRVDAGRVSLLADVEWIDGAGTDDTSLVLAVRVRAGAARLGGTIRVDGDRFAGAGVALLARVHRDLDLLAGYNDGTGMLSAAIVIRRGALDMAAGASQHPVLGLSHGASVACAR